MTTIAIVGAGRGLGAAVARKFGAEGFDIALISRNQERVDALAADLTNEGLTARGYAASVRDTAALASALDRATQELGPIEVLAYSPVPQKEFMRPVLETTAVDLAGAVEFSIYGPVTAGHPKNAPGILADTLWGMHTQRGDFRVFADADAFDA